MLITSTSVEDWYSLLNDAAVFDENSLAVIRGFYECGGQATCKELSEKYGNIPQYYSLLAMKLAKRIQKKTGCPVIQNALSENAKWWPILFVGKHAEKEQDGVYIWKLCDELKEACEMTMQSKPTVNAWLLAWNPNNYDWEHVDEEYCFQHMLNHVRSGGAAFDTWRCLSKKVQCGDRVYIMRLGAEAKGIVATGYAVSDSYVENDTKLIDIVLSDMIDFRAEPLISQESLKELFPDQQWSPQGPGIAIQPDAAQWLIENWDGCKAEHMLWRLRSFR